MEDFRKEGIIDVHPIIYEDFLPFSAAGIFQSNLGGDEQNNYEANDAKVAFELSLQSKVCDEFDLYERCQMESIDRLKKYYVQSAAKSQELGVCICLSGEESTRALGRLSLSFYMFKYVGLYLL